MRANFRKKCGRNEPDFDLIYKQLIIKLLKMTSCGLIVILP